MNNHIHLLIKEGKEELRIVFRRLGAKYVYLYNKKYKRTGHLFQDGYKPEPVNDEKYLLTVLRYIHANPIKAGIANNISKYPWSSNREYLGSDEVCDIEFVL
jgi:REP element-mobilizing transposase RayT